ncbi:hypothetical protein E2C01_096911 [Portunus trituberculatus]|uniref:Uncharacterized protein n=1 Tax=Portunus trituberculatus TaxID=210409 RepID=A0A5B7K397_PORTR|nr:hypothetical protein [Portunus trituberculatus]
MIRFAGQGGAGRGGAEQGGSGRSRVGLGEEQRPLLSS